MEDAFVGEAVKLKSRFEFNSQKAGSLHISILRVKVDEVP